MTGIYCGISITVCYFQMLQGVKSSESADMETNLTITSELKTALRTQPLGFVLRFIDQNGLEQLLAFLRGMNNPVRWESPVSQQQVSYTRPTHHHFSMPQEQPTAPCHHRMCEGSHEQSSKLYRMLRID